MNKVRGSVRRPALAGTILLTALSLLIAGNAATSSATSDEKVRLIRDISLTGNSSPSQFVSFKGKVYFSARDDAHGIELWRTDGTRAGTRMVKDIDPGADSSSPTFFRRMGDRLYFLARYGDGNTSLFRTDGTAAGTKRVNGKTSTVKKAWYPPVKLKGKLIFDGDHPQNYRALWVSDGTTKGTRALAPRRVAVGDVLVRAGKYVYFEGTDLKGVDRGLWRTDGTGAGTKRIKSFTNAVRGLSSVGTSVYFGVGGYQGPWDLWKAGPNGAQRIKSKLSSSAISGYPYDFAGYRGKVLFRISGNQDKRIWKTDGTSAGTTPLSQVTIVGAPGEPWEQRSFTKYQGKLYFVGKLSSGSSKGLWRTNGTSGGTELVAQADIHGPLVRHEGYLFFGGRESGKTSIWASNGWAGGTNPIATITPDANRYARDLTKIGTRLFFAGDDGSHGYELMKMSLDTKVTGLVVTAPASVIYKKRGVSFGVRVGAQERVWARAKAKLQIRKQNGSTWRKELSIVKPQRSVGAGKRTVFYVRVHKKFRKHFNMAQPGQAKVKITLGVSDARGHYKLVRKSVRLK